MKIRDIVFAGAFVLILFCGGAARAAYDLEVPVDPWDEYRLQHKHYSRLLLKSYDRAFANDYEGAVKDVTAAIEILPDEGLAYADRAKLYLTLNRQKDADSDFRRALYLFERALERYRPEPVDRKKNKTARRIDPAEFAKLAATTRYQRGEAYFAFEQYKNAKEDFAAACQGGSALACSRMWDITQIEKRGLNWVPLSARQFYDRQRIVRPARDRVRVWVRREDGQLPKADGGVDESIQQHLELHCATREFRLIEAFTISASSQGRAEKPEQPGLLKPIPGSAAGKLMVMLCPPYETK